MLIECSKCNGAFPLEQMTKDSSRPNGVKKICKTCERERCNRANEKLKERRRLKRLEYLEVNKVEIERVKEERAKRNKEKSALRGKEYRKTTRYKNKSLLRMYGITLEEYTRMKSEGCNACGSFERLHIDHNHQTGKVRGCLCHNCNVALGHLKDDARIIKNLLEYITNHEDNHPEG